MLRGKIAYVQVREGCSKEVASALDVDVVKVTLKKNFFLAVVGLPCCTWIFSSCE